MIELMSINKTIPTLIMAVDLGVLDDHLAAN
jgi:hypothetical protein